MKRWITFDLDGTLMQNPFVHWVFPEIEAIIRSCGGMDGPVIEALVEEHERRLDRNQIVAAYDWDGIVDQYLKANQLPVSIDVESLVVKHAKPPKIYLLEDSVLPVLALLKERGYSLAAVTNGFFKYQAPVVAELGLKPMFDRVITPEQTGFGKPDRRILEPLEREGEIVAHVGDRIDHDVLLAKRYGTTAILLFRQMPEELKELNPVNRIRQELLKRLLIKKYQKESKSNAERLDPNLTPDAVICSVSELAGLFE